MQILVNGTGGGTAVVQLASDAATVEGLKKAIRTKSGIECDQQCLVYAGQPLDEDAAPLAQYGLVDQDSVVHLTLRLLGGAKKRKKKNYTTPKKNKHKKKKVKLAVLKFYKVDENGKITRLRRECENKECGAGVFMANHADRHYCGRCRLTLVYDKPEDK